MGSKKLGDRVKLRLKEAKSPASMGSTESHLDLLRHEGCITVIKLCTSVGVAEEVKAWGGEMGIRERSLTNPCENPSRWTPGSGWGVEKPAMPSHGEGLWEVWQRPLRGPGL